MRADHRWVKQRVVVNKDEWTAITPPWDFDYFAMRCDSSAVVVRTDKDDANTEETLNQYQQDSVVGSFLMRVFHNESGTLFRCRFIKGLAICWVKSTEDTATLVVTWVL